MESQEKVLVVDDDQMSRLILAHSVERLGYSVSQAADGAEALLALNSEEFDLILLDGLMPESVNRIGATPKLLEMLI